MTAEAATASSHTQPTRREPRADTRRRVKQAARFVGDVNMKTSLCTRLAIDLPIVQAPMAGGWTTAELVAAVSNAGGLGVLAAARLSLDQLQEKIDAVRRLTSQPFG